jgi:hypothetical protein
VGKRPTAYQVRALQEFGIDVPKLGCVMLDVEPLPVVNWAPAEWAYVSNHPDRRWIKGLDAGDHITLLYGLLSNANVIRTAIDEVLDGWEPGEVSIDHVGSFPSTFEDEPYACIVGHIKVTPELIDAHARLSYLPHIDTFWEYRPHLTLAYVHKRFEQDAIDEFTRCVVHGEPLKVVGLNYGWLPDEH